LPTDTERRLKALERLAIFGGGIAAGTASGRQLAAAAARRAPVAAIGIARKHPLGTAAFIAYVAHKEGVSLETARELVEEQVESVQEAQSFVSPLLTPLPRALMDPGAVLPRYKRKISKANKAVKYGMSLLKAGTKAATGADKGKLPAKAFATATKAAGLANKRTASKIGRGRSKLKNLARKIKKWW